jgi:hypothetical protein
MGKGKAKSKEEEKKITFEENKTKNIFGDFQKRF